MAHSKERTDAHVDGPAYKKNHINLLYLAAQESCTLYYKSATTTTNLEDSPTNQLANQKTELMKIQNLKIMVET